MKSFPQDELRSHGQNGRANGQTAQPTWPRWGAIVGGGVLAAYGLSRRSKSGAALAAAGGLLAYNGARKSSNPQEVHAEASFTVNVSPEIAYQYWSNFENLPRFMSHLESVKVLDNRRSMWTARGPLNTPIQWTAEILDQRENQWIVWRSDPSSGFANSGSVQFRSAPGFRGTEVTVAISYLPPAGQIGKAFAKLFGKDPSQTIFEDLRHFKQLLEAGEIATTVGQPHGRRSAFVKAKNAIYEDSRPKAAEQVTQLESQPQEVAS